MVKIKCKEIATIGLALCLSTGAAVRTQQNDALDDAEIAAAINIELLYDNRVTANDIDVETKQGIVSLTGSVSSIGEKERAQKLASAIKGVRSVVNRIMVAPRESPSDKKLVRRVRNALVDDPASDAFELEVSVKDGVVTLEGEVESFAEKQLSGSVAKNLTGVVGLKNNIVVEYTMERSDSEIKADVLARLMNDIRVDANLIAVGINEGHIELSGTVGSEQERDQAYIDAWVAGVKSVNTEQLEVEWWARERMRQTPLNGLRAAAETRDAVAEALNYDPRIQHETVDVFVKQGVVTLGGTVDNLRARNAAAADARNTLGVRWVINNIKVRPEVPDNKTLKKRVSKKLETDGLVDRSEIQIEVNQGWITLSGEVVTSYEKTEAALVVAAVKGVVGVHNKLKYDRIWHWQPDRELKDAVLHQLAWDIFIDSAKIEVSVRHGVVTLTGTVSSWSEFNDAEKNAYQAGAKHVSNELVVENPEYQGPYGPYYYSPFFMGGFYAP